MFFNLKKLLNLEIPRNIEPIVQDQIEMSCLRLINGLEFVLKKKDFTIKSETSRKLLYQERYLTLYHYKPIKENLYSTPVILVPPLMIVSDIFDLVPEHSFVNGLLENGFNVYLVDFGKPEKCDSHLKLDDYILNFLYRAIHMSKKHSQADNVSLIGYCLGGTFSTIYASVSIDIRNDVKNVINIAGPIDLKNLPFFETFFKPFKNEWYEVAEEYGCLPKELLGFMFNAVSFAKFFKRPFYVLDKSWDKDFLIKNNALKNFFRNLQNLPAAVFKQCFEIMFSNELIAGKLKLLDQTVSFSNLQANYLAIGGSKDKFIPPDSVREVQKHISSKDFQYIEFPFGHLSIMGSEKAKDSVWKACSDWLKTRSGKFVARDVINHVSTSTI